MVFVGIPGNWEDVIGDIAAIFHFSPSELWEMDADDLLFWHAQATRVSGKGFA